MATDKEAFVERWSRLKREAEAKAAEAQPPAPKEEAPPALPPVEKLTPESDFAPFMHPKVSDAVRRVALKKLFADPRFNVPDPFEAYAGDWTDGATLSPEMLQKLQKARAALARESEPAKAGEAQPAAPQAPEAGSAQSPAGERRAAEEAAKDDGAGRKDA